MTDLSTPCIRWQGTIGTDGYGGSGPHRAHRLAYVEAYGPVPVGFHVGHVCHDVDMTCPGGPSCPHRACVNPLHLEAQTPKQNTLGGVKGRKALRTHCVNGHALQDNLYINSRGHRCCQSCARDSDAAAYQRRKARRAQRDRTSA